MERCWQHEPSSRPSFSEILDTVERIAEDAGVARYDDVRC
jgi:hypothetical protein